MPPFQGGTFNHSAILPWCFLTWRVSQKTKYTILAEGEGFEPSIRRTRMPPFQGGTFNHSAILPWCFLTWRVSQKTKYT